jgi:GxxExxY protein
MDAMDTQRTPMMTEEELGQKIIGAALNVHTTVGPALLESAYEICLAHEFEKQGVFVRRLVPIAIRYDGLTIDNGFRADMLVGDRVLVELKVVQAILPVHRSQLLSYLRLGGFKLGFLLNFHVAHLRDGGSCGWSMGFDPLRPLRVHRVPLR